MEIPNLSQTEAWKGGTLTRGRHDVEIEKATEGKSSGGHPELTVLLRAIESDPEPGAIITDWITVTEESLGRVKQFLQAANPDAADGDLDLDPASLEGRTVGITVGDHKTPDDRVVQRVTAYHRD